MRDRLKDGPCAEYRRFEDSIQPNYFVPGLGRSVNIWTFIADAIEGSGGFADGNYLTRFARENTSKRGGNARFLERVATTKYDNFARRIADAPWNRIVTHKETIRRISDDERVKQFWARADQRGLSVLQANEYPARQARSYGTGWIVVDRPARNLRNRASDMDPASLPYIYCAPTRNVVDWEFDDDYRLLAVSILEPGGSDDSDSEIKDQPVRVWTRDEWAVYEPKAGSWEAAGRGPNLIGEVPVIQLFDGYPGPGRGFGVTVMPTVARFARDVYNKSAEMRAIMRKCAAVLGVPVKSIEIFLKKVQEIGEDVLMPYDGDAGKPDWISPPLEAVDKYSQSIKDDKEAAFEAAQILAISGYLQTSSGFHSESIFQEANTAIAAFAGQLESAETQEIRLVLKYHGERDEQTIQKLASVAYPSDFGIVDMDQVLDRTVKRLDMELGVEDATDAIFSMYVAQDPREDRDELRKRAERAANARYKAAAQKQAVDAQTARGRIGLGAAGKPFGQATPQQQQPGAPQGTATQ